MHEVWVIARSDVRKALRAGATYVSFVYMAIASATYIGNYASIIGGVTAQGAGLQAVYNASRSYIDAGLFLWPFSYALLAASFGSYLITFEKNSRSFEQLLVSPLSIRQIWIGKSLGMTLVGEILGLSLYVLVFLGMSIGLVIPRTGTFVVPDALPMIVALVGAPILALEVIMLATRVQLTVTSPRTANIIFIITMVGIVVGMAVLTIKFYGAIANFAFIYLVLIVVLGILLRLASPSLTAEKVVLSSKG